MSLLLQRALPRFAGLALIASLAGCGGGGNESGPPDQVVLSTDSVTVTSPTPQCPVGPGPTIGVWGGQPPYKLFNSFPDGMSLDKTSVTDAGDSFTITFKGACMDNMPVTVEDDMGRLATLNVTSLNTPAQGSGG